MKKQNNNFAFTLVEVLVSITIFSIIIISVIWIYIKSNSITLKSDINRMLQENVKNVTNTIAEDIRKNWIVWVSSSSTDNCDFNISSNKYKEWNKLCLKSWNEYYLSKKDSVSWIYGRVNSSECTSLDSDCRISKWLSSHLTNSFVSVKDIKFYLSNDSIPKVTINIVMHPSAKKGISSDLIKESKLIFQTTITERPF